MEYYYHHSYYTHSPALMLYGSGTCDEPSQTLHLWIPRYDTIHEGTTPWPPSHNPLPSHSLGEDKGGGGEVRRRRRRWWWWWWWW